MKCIFFPPTGFRGDEWLEPPVGLSFDAVNAWNRPWIAIKDRLVDAGIDVQCFPCEVDRENDCAIYFDTPRYAAPLVKKSVLVTLEPPVVNPRQYERMKALPFARILTFVLELVDNKRVFYCPFPLVEYKPTVDVVRDKKIVAVYSNKLFDAPGELYTARRLQMLSWGKDLDLFGPGWGNDTEMIATVNYCGKWNGNKTDLLRQYSYNICYENCDVAGYATEKFGDCVQAGCIPIRRGWMPNYPMEDAFENKWSEYVFSHLMQTL